MDIETENRIADLEEKLKRVSDEWNLARDNLLWPALIGPGQLQFGSGTMRLDNEGVQIKADAAVNVPAVFFGPSLQTTPASSYPRATLEGYAISSVPGASIMIRSYEAASGNSAFCWAVVDNDESVANLTASNTAAASGAGVTAQVAVRVNDSYDTGLVRIENAVLYLIGTTADPTTVIADGQIWYRTDTDVFKGRLNGATKNFLMTGDVSGAMKVSGSGYLVYPAAAAGIDPSNSGSAWTDGAWSEVVSSTAQAVYIVGLTFTFDASSGTIEADIAIGTGAAASETEVSVIPTTLTNSGGVTTEATGVVMLPHALAVATTTRIAVRVRSSSTTLEPNNIRLIYVKQSELVAL